MVVVPTSFDKDQMAQFFDTYLLESVYEKYAGDLESLLNDVLGAANDDVALMHGVNDKVRSIFPGVADDMIGFAILMCSRPEAQKMVIDRAWKTLSIEERHAFIEGS